MRTKAYLARLTRDIDRWVEKGLIDAATAARLKEEAAAFVPGSRRDGGIIPILAAAIVALGILTLIAANWSALIGWARLGLVTAVFGGLIFGAARLSARGREVTADGLGLVATALVGGALVIVGQLYHNEATSSAFLSVWTVGGLVLALLMGSRSGLGLVGLLSLLWAGAHLGELERALLYPDGLRYVTGPLWVLPVWGILIAAGVRARWPGPAHVGAIGALLWVTPWFATMRAWEEETAVWALLLGAAFWAAAATAAEVLLRRTGIWGGRIFAGWFAWAASAGLVGAAGASYALDGAPFGLGALFLPTVTLGVFAVVAAYGSGARRIAIRNAGVAGFGVTALFFFTFVDDLVTAGLALIGFGLLMAGFVWFVGAVSARVRGWIQRGDREASS